MSHTILWCDGRFNVHGVIYIPDDGHVAPVEKEIRELADSLQDVKDEQEYIVVRERVHRNSTSPQLLYHLHRVSVERDGGMERAARGEWEREERR